MKQNEAKELLKRLQKDKYIDSKMLNKVLNFSDKVLENLNNIDGMSQVIYAKYQYFIIMKKKDQKYCIQ